MKPENIKSACADRLLAATENCASEEEFIAIVRDQEIAMNLPWHRTILEGFAGLKQENADLRLEKAMIRKLCE